MKEGKTEGEGESQGSKQFLSRTKLESCAWQPEAAQHRELAALCLHHLKRGWEAGRDVSQWTEPRLQAKQVFICQLNPSTYLHPHRLGTPSDFICPTPGKTPIRFWHRAHGANNQRGGLIHTHSPLAGKRALNVLIGAAGRKLGSC